MEVTYRDELIHYGLKGMHWGTRRWQDYDGSFNSAGIQRYFGRTPGKKSHSAELGRAPATKPSIKADSPDGSKEKNSFDKEKAKKIAKGVAIGAAVVGGTLLVAYGAKYMRDNDVVGKIRQGALENKRLGEQYKTDKLKIKLEGKAERGKIAENFKAEMQKIKESGKLDRAAIKVDPLQRVDKDVLRKELSKGTRDHSAMRKLIGEFNDSDIARLNSGKATLAELKLEKHPWSANQERYSDYYNQFKDYFGENAGKATESVGKGLSKAGKVVGGAAKNAYNAATSDKAKETYKKVATTTGNVAKKAYKAATSEKAIETYKKTGKATKEAIKTAGHIAKSSVEITKLAVQHPQETKAAMDYTTQLLKNVGSLGTMNSKNSKTVSKSNSVSNYTKGLAVKEYKHQHPGTKLSDSEIASTLGL